uniref:Uncharacterized protein n=1 Tax=Oryza sativa subsp. japonica TaxID=39947 RepID=Q6YW15_ORYSJ|nr:hypothetical protein [Oryza sativa Japonica Group]
MTHSHPIPPPLPLSPSPSGGDCGAASRPEPKRQWRRLSPSSFPRATTATAPEQRRRRPPPKRRRRRLSPRAAAAVLASSPRERRRRLPHHRRHGCILPHHRQRGGVLPPPPAAAAAPSPITGRRQRRRCPTQSRVAMTDSMYLEFLVDIFGVFGVRSLGFSFSFLIFSIINKIKIGLGSEGGTNRTNRGGDEMKNTNLLVS